jgi:hypothetical protein
MLSLSAKPRNSESSAATTVRLLDDRAAGIVQLDAAPAAVELKSIFIFAVRIGRGAASR